MKNRLRPALARGETVAGIILFTGSPMIVERAAAAGIDGHLFLDVCRRMNAVTLP